MFLWSTESVVKEKYCVDRRVKIILKLVLQV